MTSCHRTRAIAVPFLLALLGLAACASNPALAGRPAAFPGAPRPDWSSPARPVPGIPVAASQILETARTLEGRPYVFGGADPSAGFDCSGLVWYVFFQHHVQLPRTTIEQARIGLPIEVESIEAGDLVFFATTSSEPSHVGIALDSRTLIHAPSTGTVVRIERFDTPYWQSRLTGARRVAMPGLCPPLDRSPERSVSGPAVPAVTGACPARALREPMTTARSARGSGSRLSCRPPRRRAPRPCRVSVERHDRVVAG